MYATVPNVPGAGEMLLFINSKGARGNTLPFQTYLCQSEIENLGVTPFGYKDICRFDIAMNDAFGVSRIKRISNLYRQRKQPLDFERATRDAMLQRYAVEELHHDE